MSAIEKKITRRLVRACVAAGFVPRCVHDGEEYVPAATCEKAIEAIESTGMGTLHFERKSDGKWGAFGVLLITGNEEDIMSDWHCGNAEFNAAVESACDMGR